MSKEELVKAIEFGKAVIRQYRAQGREVPEWVYARQVELYEQLCKIVLK